MDATDKPMVRAGPRCERHEERRVESVEARDVRAAVMDGARESAVTFTPTDTAPGEERRVEAAESVKSAV